MKIIVPVDQAAALRRGIDAPSSTVSLEVDPSTLSEMHRRILAELLKDGHKLENGWVGGTRVDVSLKAPGVSGLMEMLGAATEKIAKDEAEKVAETAAADARAEAAIATPRVGRFKVALNEEGELEHRGHGDGVVSTTIETPAPDIDTSGCSADVRARVEAEASRRRAIRDAAIEAELPALREELTRVLAAKAERQRVIDAERAAIIQGLSEELRERIAAGVAPTKEVNGAVADAVEKRLVDALRLQGATEWTEWDREGDDLATFDAVQWAWVKRVRSAIAKCGLTGVEVAFAVIRNDETDEDEDGNETTSTSAFVARIEWSHAGVNVRIRLAAPK